MARTAKIVHSTLHAYFVGLASIPVFGSSASAVKAVDYYSLDKVGVTSAESVSWFMEAVMLSETFL